MWIEAFILGVVGWISLKLLSDVYNYWERKGFQYIKGSFPLGSKSTLEFLRRYQGGVIKEYYDELSPHPYGGFYLYRRPALLLRDPEVIKQVLVKDFSHFRSRFGKRYTKKDPLSQHLFNLEKDLWKDIRVKLTPTFTSGKLKIMYSLFEACAAEFLKVLMREQKTSGIVDIKDAVARFTIDIISTCAFGLEVDTINNPDSPLRQMSKEIFPPNIRLKRKFILILFSLFPMLRKVLHMKLTTDKMEKFLLSMVGDTIEYREKNNVVRNDFLNLLLEIKHKEENARENGKSVEMDSSMITAQCFLFFAAGFETSSSVQSYALHEMAVNPDIQDKVRTEINEVLARHGGKPTYEALKEMTYLEQVIFETMRKYPTLPIITRQCTKTWRTDSGLEIDEGTLIYIPIYALHHDPMYFPNPDNFDPERFSEANKSSIPQYAYLPFGEGPRICIGMRFGMLQTKLGLVTLLANFKISPCSKTEIPLKFVATMVISSVEGPMYIKLDKIKE